MKKINICIVGLGNIGYFHLFSLLRSSKNVNFIIIDKTKKNFLKIKKKFNNKYLNFNRIKLYFYNKIDFKNQVFDFFILSTTADMRLKIIKQILFKNKIKNILVEKVAASTFNEYVKIMNLFKKKDISNYINFSRREYEVYNYIKKKLTFENSNKIQITVKNKNWNFASNIFHFLDLFFFLTNKKEIFVEANRLERKVYNSPRKSFHELKGEMVFKDNKGSKIYCEDSITTEKNRKNKKNNFLITIESKKTIFFILEKQNLLIEFNKNDYKITYKRFQTPLQSELTYKMMKKIFSKKINLPSFQESKNLHKILLTKIMYHLKKYSSSSTVAPRIT